MNASTRVTLQRVRSSWFTKSHFKRAKCFSSLWDCNSGRPCGWRPRKVLPPLPDHGNLAESSVGLRSVNCFCRRPVAAGCASERKCARRAQAGRPTKPQAFDTGRWVGRASARTLRRPLPYGSSEWSAGSAREKQLGRSPSRHPSTGECPIVASSPSTVVVPTLHPDQNRRPSPRVSRSIFFTDF